MADAPIFIVNNLEQIKSEMIADYEARTGKTLQPAQPEMLLINAFAFRESLVRQGIQDTAVQNLVDFSSAPILDYLGALVGVTRLAPSKATVLVQFNIVVGHGGVTIPEGTRVSTIDGTVIFATTEDVLVPVGINSVIVECENNTEGASGNGYVVGTITNILDPLAFVTSVSNTSISGGGAEMETDEKLRERIKLAPSTFSTAGPRGAYEYYALSANPSIVDVAVLGPNDTPPTPPGEVHVFPLMFDGSVTPQTVIDEVEDILDDEKIRPLCDLVVVASPTRIDYTIQVDLTIYTDANASDVQQRVTDSLNEFVQEKRKSLGQDIMVARIISKSMLDGVYDVDVVSPSNDIIVNSMEFAFCTNVVVNITGTNNG